MISRSFTALAPMIRPAPGSTWAPRARWYAIRTELGKEGRVADAIERLEIPVFLPVQCRPHKRLGSFDVPLLPCYVFAHVELSYITNIMQIDYVTGFKRDSEGFPAPINEAQMEKFRNNHREWLMEEMRFAHSGQSREDWLKAENKRKSGRGRKARDKKKSMTFEDGLKTWKEENLGEEAA